MSSESFPSDLENLLMKEELPKTLSITCKELFKNRPKALIKCREWWEAEVSDIQGEAWDDTWDHLFQHLVAASDRLIHFKLLHRIYYTPARLASIYQSVSADCWRCSFSTAAADHIFWSCLQIQQFWTAVTSCISEVLLVPIHLTIKVCLLGLVEEVVPSWAHRTLLNILLFYGRKAILLQWKKPGAPDIQYNSGKGWLTQ